MSAANKHPNPIHPGEILREDFLPEYDLNPYDLEIARAKLGDQLNSIKPV